MWHDRIEGTPIHKTTSVGVPSVFSSYFGMGFKLVQNESDYGGRSVVPATHNQDMRIPDEIIRVFRVLCIFRCDSKTMRANYG